MYYFVLFVYTHTYTHSCINSLLWQSLDGIWHSWIFSPLTVSSPQTTAESLRCVTSILVGIHTFLIVVKKGATFFIRIRIKRTASSTNWSAKLFFSHKPISKYLKQTLGIMTWDKIISLFNFPRSALQYYDFLYSEHKKNFSYVTI